MPPFNRVATIVVAVAHLVVVTLRVISHEDVPPDEAAKYETATRDVATLAAAVRAYRAAEGRWPPALDALVPTFVDSSLRDPWGGKYGYVVTNDRAEVWCLGRDGQPGRGVGPDLDIWEFLEPGEQ
jgi:hypothetical protein